ncbi:hypothetical protein [Pseudodesulfovibrio sediminis]|uniref:Uncharacterized protein n=1 Tax=Pseudodesulfovibrio sediminis TaxID=2810563 RepID=A0ABN6EPJ2_9BACT|nr:hypothetical protein [Pseudodesulfovibrio sediminis]BCS86981.1 hypothetical protein PSDVSF_02230 [Pseudodesulfovibrio sediminis]
MDISIDTPHSPLPTDRAHTLSMVIKSFKGRRDVAVHLFRGQWGPSDENLDWATLIGPPLDATHTDPAGSRKIILESFTDVERDRIISYLKEQYSTRLTGIRSAVLTFPVPAGLTGLTQVEPGKARGFIEFEKIPSYPLDIPLKGFYDLNQHQPMVEE